MAKVAAVEDEAIVGSQNRLNGFVDEKACIGIFGCANFSVHSAWAARTARNSSIHGSSFQREFEASLVS